MICREKQYEHCGCCQQMPCGKYSEFRAPEMTDEQVARNHDDRKAELLWRVSFGPD